MKARILILLVILLLLSASSAAEETFLRQIVPQSAHGYSFDLSGPATLSLTMMWNRITADMAIEVHCRDQFETELWRRGRSSSSHDRMMRLDVGLEGGLYCEVYVVTSATCVYALNFAWFGQLTLTPVVISASRSCEGKDCPTLSQQPRDE